MEWIRWALDWWPFIMTGIGGGAIVALVEALLVHARRTGALANRQLNTRVKELETKQDKQLADCMEENKKLVENQWGLNEKINRLTDELKRTPAIIIVNGSGYIVEWSPAATKMFHWKRFEAIGKHCGIIVPERYKAVHEEGIKLAVCGTKTEHRSSMLRSLEVEGLTKGGVEIPIRIELETWVTEGQRYYAAEIHVRSET